MAAGTSTRPGALISNILYHHVEFQVFQPSSPSQHACVGLVVDLQHVKSKAGSHIIFGFHKEATLLHDPIAHMFAITLADKAFLNNITNLS